MNDLGKDETRDQIVSTVDDVVIGRFANRFLSDQPISKAQIHEILNVARFTASGGNTQPWNVHIVGGTIKDALSASMLAEHEAAPFGHTSEYDYYPAQLPEPFATRKTQFGTEFYGWLGIAQDDQEGRLKQTSKNFLFFGAPIGMIFTLDRSLTKGSWLDLGMFIQSVMLVAKSRGIDSCPQEVISRYHLILRDHLPIDDGHIVVCGMSLGFPDNKYLEQHRMPKAAVEEFASFYGF